jgi:hypothetical protein
MSADDPRVCRLPRHELDLVGVDPRASADFLRGWVTGWRRGAESLGVGVDLRQARLEAERDLSWDLDLFDEAGEPIPGEAGRLLALGGWPAEALEAAQRRGPTR